MKMQAFQIPNGAIRTDQPRIVLSGREELIIQRHTGLFSYETKCIRIRTKGGLVTVTGENLVIEYFGLEDLLIRGRVDTIGVDGQME